MGLDQNTIEAFLVDAQAVAEKMSNVSAVTSVSVGARRRVLDIIDHTWKNEVELRGKQVVLQRTLGFANQLLQLTDTEIRTLRSGQDERESGEYFMELATVAHLTLYFLGFHFGHLWERVRTHAQEKFAFPEGICVYKGNGDIYRRTRQLHLRLDHGHGQPPEEATVLVYTRDPAFLSSYQAVVAHHEKARLPATLYGLAYLYNLLQFYLYMDEGLPIEFVIQGEAFGALLKSNPDDVWRKIQALFPRSKERVDVRVVKGTDVGIFPCVLGYRRGFHRSGTNAVVLTESSLHSNLRNDFAGLIAASHSLKVETRQGLSLALAN